MANQLDLEEQEQLDQLKHFWKQYGNLITWALIVVLGAFAAWNGYQLWQRNQSVQAAAMFDEIEKVVNSGDAQKIERAFSDMKDRFAKSVYTQQAGLMVAKVSYEGNRVDAAKATLNWLVENASDPGYASVARLRLSALLIEEKNYADALKLLASGISDDFSALSADRKGDIHVLQGNKPDAITEYKKAFNTLEEQSEYRRLVGVKLNALGVNPQADSKIAAISGGAK